jgi:peptidyl-prolyl cis-trans isomerase C
MMHDDTVVHLLIFLGLTGVACFAPSPSLRAEEQNVTQGKKVVAKVNGKPIYEERLNPKVQNGLRRFRKYGMRNEAPDLVQRLQKRALDRVIGEELIFQASQRLTIEDADEKVTRKLRALQRRYATGERFEEYLRQNNLTMEDVRSSLRARVYVDEYLKEKGISKPQLSDERIRDAYERNPESYSEEASVKISHILIAVDRVAETEAHERARQRAEQIRNKLLAGKDFAQMARKHSDCNSASGGGNLGYVKRGYMPPEFDKVAFAMERGTVSEAVKTRFGYHIIKVLDTKPAGVAPYEEVRGFIERYLQEEESKRKLAAHIAELKERAKIEIIE